MNREAKLICGVIANSEWMLEKVIAVLKENFGDIDKRSKMIPFDFTNYYEKEMGKGLIREWVSFLKPIKEDEIKNIKLKTIKLEKWLANKDGSRNVNIDPGYVSLSKLVLASTKDYAHRIYLGDGIFAEITLIYRKGAFQPLEWTYPDYRQNTRFFEEVREELKHK
ncbi:MAG TPA: DUF4416 family protein [bacterium (Candidatus Stahlbacteria)]|nr:DUF4416 family protein [Candidatus Stahlbacteria bacterium]